MGASESTVALCDQCGGVLPVKLGTAVTDCAFCGTANHVDRARTVFHYAVRQTVRDADALAALRRWMAGNLTVKNLDRKATIETPRYTLFPFWMVHARQQAQEQVWLKPAAGIAVSEVSDLTIPASALESFADVSSDDAQPATVPVTALERWLAADHAVPAGAIGAIALVHLPLFICHYQYDGRR